MKHIVSYITEGLKINKNTKVTNEYTKEILDFLFGEPDDCSAEEFKVIDDWVKDNKIKKLSFISTEDVLLGYGFESDDIKDLCEYFTNKKDLKLIIDDDLYDKLYLKIGKKVWEDQYGHNALYILDNKLSLKSRFARGYIFMVANEDL